MVIGANDIKITVIRWIPKTVQKALLNKTSGMNEINKRTKLSKSRARVKNNGHQKGACADKKKQQHEVANQTKNHRYKNKK